MAKDQGRGDMPNELRAGVWKSGDLIFSENQWVQYLGISRMTRHRATTGFFLLTNHYD